MFRSFHNSDIGIDNPFYGLNGASHFDFTRLPDHIFLKILLHLPLEQRVHARRISQRWLTMANTALAVDTNIVDTNEQYFQMTPDQFQSFLPLVSDCLEVLILRYTLDSLLVIGSFPALRTLIISPSTFSDIAALTYVLRISPKLKVLMTRIPTILPIPDDSHGLCSSSVEKLILWGNDSIDPQLLAFLEYFPNLNHINVTDTDHFTANCISWVMEKYGSKLRHLKLSAGYISKESWPFPSPSFDAVTGIQLCSNLQYLQLFNIDWVSNVFVNALAAGCHKLETLDLTASRGLTRGGLTALAVLPNLTRLDISNVTGDLIGLNEGVAAIAREGRLIELVARSVILPAACLKTIVGHCRQLKLLSNYNGCGILTMEDATEIVHLYSTRSMEPRLIFRSQHRIWQTENVCEVIEEMKETKHRHFLAQHHDCQQFLIDNKEEMDFDNSDSNYSHLDSDSD